MASRKEFEASLKVTTLPLLRSLGFKGSYPHLRRQRGDFVDILAFQFSAWGGRFCIEVGRASPEGVTNSDGTTIPIEKVRHYHLRHRYRLGSSYNEHTDHWFDFENAQLSELAETLDTAIQDPQLWPHIDAMPV